MRKLVMLVLGVTAVTTPAVAQQHPDSVRHRNSCRLAEQVLVTGNPAPHREWAGMYIHICGTETLERVTLERIERLRRSGDRQAVMEVWQEAYTLRTPTFRSAMLELAQDRTAGIPARVHALQSLALNAYPRHDFTYESMTGGFTNGEWVRGGCSAGIEVGSGWRSRPVPPDAELEGIMAVARRLALDETEPLDVRTAASCIVNPRQHAAGPWQHPFGPRRPLNPENAHSD